MSDLDRHAEFVPQHGHQLKQAKKVTETLKM